MQASVENLSNVERRLTIVVPNNKVKEAYNKALNNLAKKANLKGFRPGKVPLHVIQKKFDSDLRQETVSELIQESLQAALLEKNLRPINTPKVEAKPFEQGQSFEFSASFEVFPEIGAIQLSMDSLVKPLVEITDEDISNVLTHLTKQYTQWRVVDRPAQEKDRVIIDYQGFFAGQEDGTKTSQLPIELGSNVMLPGFEEGLLGAVVNEERTLKLSYPDDFSIKERAGQPVEYKIVIKQIFEAEPPVLDEEFIKKIGIASGKEEDLKAQIKQSLELEKERAVTDRVKEQLFEALFTQNPLEVPKSLIEREANRIHDEVYQHQKEHNHNHSKEEMDMFSGLAQKRVAISLLLSEFAKQIDLKADQERVRARIQEISSSYENPTQVIAWLSKDENRVNIESQVAEDQVMEKLLEKVKITNKPMSYAELKGIRL